MDQVVVRVNQATLKKYIFPNAFPIPFKEILRSVKCILCSKQ